MAVSPPRAAAKPDKSTPNGVTGGKDGGCAEDEDDVDEEAGGTSKGEGEGGGRVDDSFRSLAYALEAVRMSGEAGSSGKRRRSVDNTFALPLATRI